MGGGHSCRRRGPLHGPDVVRPGGKFPWRPLASHRALHADRPRPHELRGHDRGPDGLHQTLENKHAALSPQRAEPATAGVRACIPGGGRPETAGAGKEMKVTALAVIAVAAGHASFAGFIATSHASAASGQDATRQTTVGSCPTEPVAFHKCAQERAKTYNPARTRH